MMVTTHRIHDRTVSLYATADDADHHADVVNACSAHCFIVNDNERASAVKSA